MDGEPWYLVGYYPKLNSLTAQQHGKSLRAYYQALHEQLSSNGLNYYRALFNLGMPLPAEFTQTLVYQRSNTPGAADRGNKFDLDSFNDAHFEYWRDLIEDAANKGIVVQLCLMNSWHVKEFKSKPARLNIKYDFYHGDNNINGVHAVNADEWHSTDPGSTVRPRQIALIEKVVDRLGDLPNIVWEVSNEPRPYYDGGDKPETGRTPNNWALQMAQHLKEYELKRWKRNHLCFGVDLPDHQHTAGQRPDWWVTSAVEKDGHTPAGAHRDLVTQVRTMALSQPLITDNDAGQSQLTAAGRRQKAWAALTAGVHMDYFQEQMDDIEDVQSPDVAEAMRCIGFVRRFLRQRSVNLRGMIPSDERVSTGWCLARPGDEYIIYLIAGGRSKVSDLSERYIATWFNPRTAAFQNAGQGPTFEAPDEQDWVLYIHRDHDSALRITSPDSHENQGSR